VIAALAWKIACEKKPHGTAPIQPATTPASATQAEPRQATTASPMMLTGTR
jgi:hypothetical protein